MTMLSRADILAANDLPTKTIKVPEWKGSVTLRAWSAETGVAIAKLSAEAAAMGFVEQLPEKILALSVINPDGTLMFTEDDLSALSKKSPAALHRVYHAAMALNNVSHAESDEAPKN